jgi:hypothetical protein
MATQVIGGKKRSRLSAALIALVLAFAVFVLATQASSIWSTTTGPQVQPAPLNFSLSAKDLKDLMNLSKGAHLPDGCRVKFGCQHDGNNLRRGHSVETSKP